MLSHSFCHLSGVREAGEEMLWRRGILCWNDLVRAPVGLLSTAKHAALCAALPASRAALAAADLGYFLARLPLRHRVRVLPEVLNRTAFVDVETDGLDPQALVTTVVVLRNGNASGYVRGPDLDRLATDLRSAALLVTYNGTRFDLPVLRRHGLLEGQPHHLDLCPVLHAWGLYGGLKKTAQRLGIRRPAELTGRTGAEAAALWHRYARDADASALVELLRYNAWDALALPQLAWRVLAWSMAGYPLRRSLPECGGLPAVLALSARTIAL